MNMNKRLLIGLGVLVVVATFLIIAFSLAGQAKSNLPTPTPTLGPAMKVTCLGGQVFLRDAKVKEYLLADYNIDVESISVGTFEMKDKDLTGIDCIWPGSASGYEDFTTAKPGLVRKHDTIFRTYGLFYTRRDLFLQPLLDSGIVYGKNGAYYMKMAPVIEAMNSQEAWVDIGVPIPGRVNIRYTNPAKSSGGLQHLFLLCNYQMPGGVEGGLVCDLNGLPTVLPNLVANWAMQPRQAESSPEWFEDYVYQSGSIPLAASSESLYLGWRNKLPQSRRESDGNLIVGIYPEWTVSTDHVLGSLTENGDRLVEIFGTDETLQALGWSQYGMRTAAGGIAAKPGDTDVPWLVANPQSVGEPKRDVFEAIKTAIQ